MLREQGMADRGGRPAGSFWSFIGGASGGALGFIIGNMPGLVAGAVAGNRLGAVRDARGKSVYAVFLVSSIPSLVPKSMLLTWRRNCLRMIGRDFLASSPQRYLVMRRACKVRVEAMMLVPSRRILRFCFLVGVVWRYPYPHKESFAVQLNQHYYLPVCHQLSGRSVTSTLLFAWVFEYSVYVQ